MTAGPILLASFIRTFRGTLGLWCIVGPLMPFAFLESDRITAIGLSIGIAMVIFGLIVWKLRTGSAAIIRTIFKDAGLGLVFSLLGGITAATLFGINLSAGNLLVAWGCFFILEWRKNFAVPLVPKAA